MDWPGQNGVGRLAGSMTKTQQQHEENAAFWMMFEHLFDAVAIVDTSRAIQYANKRFRKLAQIKGSEYKNIDDITNFLEIPYSCWDSLSEDSQASQPLIHSVPFTFRAGAKGFAQIFIQRIWLSNDHDHKHPMFMVVLHDMTFEIQNRTKLDESERTIADLKRRHAEAQFLWRLSTETPIYLEPLALMTTIVKKLKDDLGFTDACFLNIPDQDHLAPEPIAGDPRLGSRMREVAQSLLPTLRKKVSRSDVFPHETDSYGTFWVTNLRPKLEKPFFLLARTDERASEANRRALLDPLASQITGWLDNRSMYLSSITDSLTGLFNRRHFDSRFSVECLLSRDQQSALSLLVIDIDFFKKINDSFGHQVGDEVLKVIAKTIRSVLRTSDITARIGGEEFGALLFDTNIHDAFKAAEKLRKRIADTPIPLSGFDQAINVTVSIGVASISGDQDTPESVFKIADENLYKAKAAGRNCIR